jgi:hypothetical protein
MGTGLLYILPEPQLELAGRVLVGEPVDAPMLTAFFIVVVVGSELPDAILFEPIKLGESLFRSLSTLGEPGFVQKVGPVIAHGMPFQLCHYPSFRLVETATVTAGCRTLRDLRNGRAATSRRGLDVRQGRTGQEHRRNALVASDVLFPALVEPFRLRLCLALRLPSTAILEVLAGYGGKHVQHHRIDCVEHAGCEVIDPCVRHHPRGWQVKGDDTDMTGGKLAALSRCRKSILMVNSTDDMEL